MSKVQRVCVQCGAGNPVEARYCASCGYDSQGALPVQRSNLPLVIGQAALPVLVGAASLVARAGWRLLQSRLAQSAASSVSKASQPVASQARPEVVVGEAAARRPKRSIHIRSAWAINNGNGWQQGTSEQTIEFDD
jgi:hypothetical protein